MVNVKSNFISGLKKLMVKTKYIFSSSRTISAFTRKKERGKALILTLAVKCWIQMPR